MGNFKNQGPICARNNPSKITTPGPVGLNDCGDPTDPHEGNKTTTTLGLIDPGIVSRTVKANYRKIDPLSRPTPLEEIGVAARNKLFQIADGCRKNCKKASLKNALDDSKALKKACEKVKVGNKAAQDFLTRLGYKNAKSKIQKRNGIAFADVETMTVIFTADFVKTARAGGKYAHRHVRYSSALAFFRLVYLHEQCHLYLQLRGIHNMWTPDDPWNLKRVTSIDPKKGFKDLDKIFKSIGKSNAATISCHHQAIPYVEKFYNNKFGRKKYGYIKNYRRIKHI